jgi:hypothetical protein
MSARTEWRNMESPWYVPMFSVRNAITKSAVRKQCDFPYTLLYITFKCKDLDFDVVS